MAVDSLAEKGAVANLSVVHDSDFGCYVSDIDYHSLDVDVLGCDLCCYGIDNDGFELVVESQWFAGDCGCELEPNYNDNHWFVGCC